MAGFLLSFFHPANPVHQRLVSLLENIVTVSESLPLVVLNEKTRNPHGMSMLQETVRLRVNGAYEMSLEPWVTIGEIALRVVTAKMGQSPPLATGEQDGNKTRDLLSSDSDHARKSGASGKSSRKHRVGDHSGPLGVAGVNAINSDGGGVDHAGAPCATSTSTKRGEFSRDYLSSCLDLIGCIVVNANQQYFDVLDFTIKTRLDHPTHLLAPSGRMRNVASQQRSEQRAAYSPASMSPPMGAPGSQPYVPIMPTEPAGVPGGSSMVVQPPHSNSLSTLQQNQQTAGAGSTPAQQSRFITPQENSSPTYEDFGTGVQDATPNSSSATVLENVPTGGTAGGAAGTSLPSSISVGLRQFLLSQTLGWQVAVRMSRDPSANREQMVLYASSLNVQGHHIAINPAAPPAHPLTKAGRALRLWALLAQQQFGRGKLLGQILKLRALVEHLQTMEDAAPRPSVVSSTSGIGAESFLENNIHPAVAERGAGGGLTTKEHSGGGGVPPGVVGKASSVVGGVTPSTTIGGSTATASLASSDVVSVQSDNTSARRNSYSTKIGGDESAGGVTTAAGTIGGGSAVHQGGLSPNRSRRSLNPLTLLRKAISSSSSKSNQVGVAPEISGPLQQPAEQGTTKIHPDRSSISGLTAAGSSTAGSAQTVGAASSSRGMPDEADKTSALKFPIISTAASSTISSTITSTSAASGTISFEPFAAEALFVIGYRPSVILRAVDMQIAGSDDVLDLFRDEEFGVGEIVDSSWQKVVVVDSSTPLTATGALEFLLQAAARLEGELQSAALLAVQDTGGRVKSNRSSEMNRLRSDESASGNNGSSVPSDKDDSSAGTGPMNLDNSSNSSAAETSPGMIGGYIRDEAGPSVLVTTSSSATATAVFDAQDRIWAVFTEFPSGIPFNLIWEDLVDFVFGKCKAFLGKQVFSENLFSEGCERLEVQVNETGRGCIWGGLTRRLAEGLAAQLSEALPCQVEADPNGAKSWGANVAPNIALRSVVQYSGGLGHICDITVRTAADVGKTNISPSMSGALPPMVFPPAVGGPSTSSHHLGMSSESASSLVNLSHLVEVPPVRRASDPLVITSSEQKVDQAGGAETWTSGIAPSSDTQTHHQRGARAMMISGRGKSSQWAVSAGEGAVVSYSVMDIYSGELIEGFMRSQLDPHKTKITAVHGINSANEIQRQMSLACSYANWQNQRLMHLEASIFGMSACSGPLTSPRGSTSGGGGAPLPSTATVVVNAPADEENKVATQQRNGSKTPSRNSGDQSPASPGGVLGGAAAAEQQQQSPIMSRPNSGTPRGSSSMTTRSHGSSSNLHSSFVVSSRIRSNESVLSGDDPILNKSNVLSANKSPGGFLDYQIGGGGPPSTEGASSPRTASPDSRFPTYKTVRVPIVRAQLAVSTRGRGGSGERIVMQSGETLCQAVWAADSPYGARRKTVYSHLPTVGGTVSKPLRLEARITYQSAPCTNNNNLKFAASWPAYQEDASISTLQDLGITSLSCCHAVELLRRINLAWPGMAREFERSKKEDENQSATLDLNINTAALDAKLREQLSVPLLSVTRAGLPKWVFVLPQICPSLFHVDLRKSLLINSCFPLSFRVYWLQQERFEHRFGLRLQEAERKLQEVGGLRLQETKKKLQIEGTRSVDCGCWEMRILNFCGLRMLGNAHVQRVTEWLVGWRVALDM